jgi:hypothetical protein
MHIIYTSMRMFHVVVFPDLLVAEDVTIWHQIHGYNTEPRCAILVEVEARVSEIIVVEVDKI